MSEVKRRELPDWPRLMSEDQAAAYLSMSRSFLREYGPKPCRLRRRIFYDRRDLDNFADVLSGQPLEGQSLEAARRETERRYFAEQAAKRKISN